MMTESEFQARRPAIRQALAAAVESTLARMGRRARGVSLLSVQAYEGRRGR
ncbi:hypothetical protein J2T57_001633 [Natronocella acetinitrilica]|uniref:Uncharacterized protein n=1 Tax=Natronocella acetinitrilica TaxID=414046 RepID=A0AAE3G4D2_9GAMM|nr:hypothetical protein [Natronocella acetinitrilica]MCP1674531.1 hypothetical protein [Natronocella acetinitrilica]